jgi:hypothetical protein
MRTSLFIAIVLLAGCAAGTIHGLVNLAIVEPYLDTAIGIENKHLFESGKENDTPEFWAEYYSYRAWQKGGQVLAGAILGTSIGALFGIVFAYSRNVLPGGHIKKSLILAAIMWVTLYIIPFTKYPANPPTVGDPETIILRQALYLVFIAISGLGALGFYQIYKRIDKKIFAFVGYAVFSFRATAVIGASVYWIAVGLILGALWQKLQPDIIKQTKIQ